MAKIAVPEDAFSPDPSWLTIVEVLFHDRFDLLIRVSQGAILHTKATAISGTLCDHREQ